MVLSKSFIIMQDNLHKSDLFWEMRILLFEEVAFYILGKRSAKEPKLPEAGSKVPMGQKCFRKIGAVLSLADGVYVFNDDKLYILKRNMRHVKGPVPVSSVFKGVQKVDAAFIRHNGKITLFSGNQ